MKKDGIEQRLMRILHEQKENKQHHAPYEEELSFYELIKSGDMASLGAQSKIPFSEQTLRFGRLSDDKRRNTIYHLIVTIAMITRFCMEGGLDPETAYTLSDICIREADRTRTIEELDELHAELVSVYTQLMEQLKKTYINSRPIIRCIDFINVNLHAKITLADVSKHVQLSTAYVSKLFKKEMDVSFTAYVRKQRIEEAKRMLKNSDYTCSAIACFLAFSSQSHFTQVFRKETGMTPKQYRDRYFRHNFVEPGPGTPPDHAAGGASGDQ